VKAGASSTKAAYNSSFSLDKSLSVKSAEERQARVVASVRQKLASQRHFILSEREEHLEALAEMLGYYDNIVSDVERLQLSQQIYTLRKALSRLDFQDYLIVQAIDPDGEFARLRKKAEILLK